MDTRVAFLGLAWYHHQAGAPLARISGVSVAGSVPDGCIGGCGE